MNTSQGGYLVSALFNETTSISVKYAKRQTVADETLVSEINGKTAVVE